jgi:tripeptidyl-peptidase-2
MSRGIGLLLVAFGMAGSMACAQGAGSWSQLSLSTCRVEQFMGANPESDGCGVVIAVMDTGVDPSIPGLTRTPDGEVKVIDLQDFTGEGDIELHRVRRDEQTGDVIEYDEDGSPIHYSIPDLPADPSGEERLFWFGYFDESRFVNSEVSDLNDNGTTEDKFPILVTALSGDGDDQAVCYVDGDLDRSFADQKPLKNYKLNYDSFTLYREKPEEQIIPLTFAVNIFLRQAKVNIVYDDGAHGTHVAGIAAGYRINNQDGFNGVAPGTKVIGLKIGQNAIGGVSTTDAFKKALEYAARFSRERGMPVVCNLSFGVDSVIEGNSDIDKWIDEFMVEDPYMLFVTSGGNTGPGISTVGTPATAREALAVAALLAPDSARDVMGISIDEPVVSLFSSRGAEAGKPDIITPGFCTSTVPRWVRGGDYWAGTSMSSPYTAGLCAVLISDAMRRHPGVPIRAFDVKRALCLSAKPMEDTTPLAVGYGLADLPDASKLLRKLVNESKDDAVIGYDISTPCPHGYKGTARTAYWRSTYLPTDEQQRFTIKPVFAPTTDKSAITSFVRKFQLRSTAPWCELAQQEVYLRSEQSARVYVEYDAEQLKEPGLYVGTVEAVHDGLVAFRLINAIVVPYQAKEEYDFMLEWENQTAKGWEPERYFVAVPPGASAMHVTLSAPEGKESKAAIDRIFDPTGMQLRDRGKRLNTTDGTREVKWAITEDLIPGVWELPVAANRPDKEWPYDLSVRFFGVYADPPVITEWGGSPPAGELLVVNVFADPVPVAVDGTFEGFRKYVEDNFKGLKDELTYSVTLDENYNQVRVNLEMTKEAYATTTDIGVAVEVNGEEVSSGAFDNRFYETTVSVPSPKKGTTVTLHIRAGFAVADDQRETPITVMMDQLLARPIPIKVTQDDAAVTRLIPSVPMELEFALGDAPPDTPEGLEPVGYLTFKERGTDQEVLRVPIDIE